MKRFIVQKLLKWKDQTSRKPLLLRGARQVGKTYSILDFGNSHFTGKVHHIDLEKHLDWHPVFEKNLDVNRILAELEILLNSTIIPGQDLLFFDEIQSCPRAMMALRYFYEDMPELHVIAAGSLIEFALKDISFPVGRIQILDMHPMSFGEYLLALGKDKLAEIVLETPHKLQETVHRLLLDHLHDYFFVGGMPECVKTFVANRKFTDVFEIQTQLIDAYRQDFSKYAPYADKRCLNAVFINTAKSIGTQIKYSRLAEGFTNPTIKKAFDLLTLAKVIYKVPAASSAGLPLSATASAKKFKAIMVDIGLMQNLCGMNISEEFKKSDLLAIYQGALAEQFVGQEILASGNTELFFWARAAKSSTAEVDYLVTKDGIICPIEVKSAASGRLRSLHQLLKNYPNIQTGYVCSTAPYSELPEQKLIFLPLYYAGSFSPQKSLS